LKIKTKSSKEKRKFANLIDEYDHKRPSRGQIVQGEILELYEDMAILDIGAKRDAIVPSRDLAQLDKEVFEDFSIGDKVPVYVSNTPTGDVDLMVSIEKGQIWSDWERAEECLNNGEILELEVVEYNKGGLQVAFGKLRGFVPNSHLPELQSLTSYEEVQAVKEKNVGTTLRLRVIEVDRQRERFVLSVKAAEGANIKRQLLDLEVGQQISGRVTNIVDFGAFVDLGVVDGLIHISNLDWRRVEHPSEVLQIGDDVEVIIESVDAERERVGLSRKALLPNPWEQFTQQNRTGDLVEGAISNVRDFGAFVQLNEEITGLIHISEMSFEDLQSMQETLHPGEKVQVRILEIDVERERVGLSLQLK
jgi:small subunit ribosomal protein S1